MSKVVDTWLTGTELDRSNFSAGEYVDEADWDALISNMHHVWSRQGARMCGPIFEPEPYNSTSTAYANTQVGGSPAVDNQLDVWYGVCTPQRRIESGGSLLYSFTLIVYGKNVDVRATPTRFNDGSTTPLTAITASTSTTTDSEWATATQTYSEASCHMAGSTANDLATLGWYVEARTKGGSAGTHLVHTFAIIETIGTSSELPDS